MAAGRAGALQRDYIASHRPQQLTAGTRAAVAYPGSLPARRAPAARGGPGALKHIPPDVYHSTIRTGTGVMCLLAAYAPPGPEAELRQMAGVGIEPPARKQ